jgi:hypothetical protein
MGNVNAESRLASIHIVGSDHADARLPAGIGGGAFVAPTNLIGKLRSPETEVPFESVQLGDRAKPI